MRDTAGVLRALNARTRREILSLIWDRELPAGEIAAAFSLTPATISQHLSVLRDAGLVEMTAQGTSRLYRAVPKAMEGLHGALEAERKWVPATRLPERELARTQTEGLVRAEVDVALDREQTFRAFIDPALYSAWMGVPVRIEDGRFAATLEWGTEVRGRYELVSPPRLIVMSWDFDDDNIPVPGRELTAYLWVRPLGPSASRVEVHQLTTDSAQAEFFEAAWALVLGRLRAGVVEAVTNAGRQPQRRPRRPKNL